MIKAVIDTNVIVSAYITKNLDAATHFKMWDFFCHQIYAKGEQAPSELTKKICQFDKNDQGPNIHGVPICPKYVPSCSKLNLPRQ